MEIYEKIQEDLKQAMKQKQEVELSTLRMIKAAIINKQKEGQSELSSEDVSDVLRRLSKQYQDAIDAYRQAGREDLVASEQQELEVLKHYLPKEMSEDEVRAFVSSVLASLSGEQRNNFGSIMGAVMKELKGKADGSLVQRIVKELTQK